MPENICRIHFINLFPNNQWHAVEHKRLRKISKVDKLIELLIFFVRTLKYLFQITPCAFESSLRPDSSQILQQESTTISPTVLHNDIDVLLDNLAKADINNVDERVRILLGILPKEEPKVINF